jgi:hypothetical protein
MEQLRVDFLCDSNTHEALWRHPGTCSVKKRVLLTQGTHKQLHFERLQERIQDDFCSPLVEERLLSQWLRNATLMSHDVCPFIF